MPLIIEGLRINMSIQALAETEGFVTELNVSWNTDQQYRNAVQQAKQQGIIGRRLNVHETTFSDALTAISNEVTAFETEVGTFITEFNAEQTV